MFGDRHDETELLIDLIEGALSEEGYCANRYSGGSDKRTTAYDAIHVEDGAGRKYAVIIEEE